MELDGASRRLSCNGFVIKKEPASSPRNLLVRNDFTWRGSFLFFYIASNWPPRRAIGAPFPPLLSPPADGAGLNENLVPHRTWGPRQQTPRLA